MIHDPKTPDPRKKTRQELLRPEAPDLVDDIAKFWRRGDQPRPKPEPGVMDRPIPGWVVIVIAAAVIGGMVFGFSQCAP